MSKPTRPISMPAEFWEAMPAQHCRMVARVAEDGYMPLPAGSRYICPEHAREDSDWDVYFRAGRRYAAGLVGEGVVVEALEGIYGANSFSIRRDLEGQGSLNLLAFHDPETFQKFHDLTTLCHECGGPTDRDKRLAKFKFKVEVTYDADLVL